MAKFIGVKMIKAVPMTAREANDKGHKIGNHSFEEDGYEVTYPDGYKSWSPAKEFKKAYYKLEDPAGDILKENDIKRFIKDIENVKVDLEVLATKITLQGGDKGAARVGDKVKVTIPANTFLVSADAGVKNPAPVEVEGTVQEGSGTVLIGD